MCCSSGEERLQAKANLDAAKDERRRRAFIDLKDLDNDMWRGVFDTLGLGRNGMLDKKTRPVSGPMIVPDFCWDDSDKDAQSHRWDSYMECARVVNGEFYHVLRRRERM